VVGLSPITHFKSSNLCVGEIEMQEEDGDTRNSEQASSVDGGDNAIIDETYIDARRPAPTPEERLADIAAKLKKGEPSPTLTVRTLLGWFGYQRRGAAGVMMIDLDLAMAGLTTDPDYHPLWIDSEITFVLRPTSTKPNVTPASDQQPPPRTNFDPTYQLSRLGAANNPPVSVSPQQTVEQAITIMMANDFSQLPVMSGERTVNGLISHSSIAKQSVLGARCDSVQDCIESAHIVKADTFLFDAISDIINNECVLVQGADGRITGIVTTSDLSLEFRHLAEPFLLLGEIEQHIRALIERGDFKPDELKEFRDEKDSSRTVSKVSDLSFGEYLRLLENPAQWERLQLKCDRANFVKPLEKIRTIRNDIMHFDPDPLGEDDLIRLRNSVTFLQSLRKVLYR